MIYPLNTRQLMQKPGRKTPTRYLIQQLRLVIHEKNIKRVLFTQKNFKQHFAGHPTANKCPNQTQYRNEWGQGVLLIVDTNVCVKKNYFMRVNSKHELKMWIFLHN